MLKNPKVGMKVRLSRSGYQRLKLDTPEKFDEAKEMIITSAHQIGCPQDPVWDIRVDKKGINMYMLDQTMFDEV